MQIYAKEDSANDLFVNKIMFFRGISDGGKDAFAYPKIYP